MYVCVILSSKKFKQAVEKLISSEEKTNRKFPSNKDNNNKRGSFDYRNNDKRPRQDNTVALANKRTNTYQNMTPQERDRIKER
jgi:hypothetical protein